MKFLIVLCILWAVVCAEKSCFDAANRFCARKDKPTKKNECDVVYGGVEHVKHELQDYVRLHLDSSFNYLLMSTNMGGYLKNREGMEKIQRNLSDRTWSDAIELIKYMNKRGVNVNLQRIPKVPIKKIAYNGSEVEALVNALDHQKHIADEAYKIHTKALERGDTYDPEVAAFLEDNFVHRHADVIRNLAGLISDLIKLTDSKSSGLSQFIFDEYLKKM